MSLDINAKNRSKEVDRFVEEKGITLDSKLETIVNLPFSKRGLMFLFYSGLRILKKVEGDEREKYLQRLSERIIQGLSASGENIDTPYYRCDYLINFLANMDGYWDVPKDIGIQIQKAYDGLSGKLEEVDKEGFDEVLNRVLNF